MNNDASVRVFRRNNKNTIIVWNTVQLDTEYNKPVIAALINDIGQEIILTYSKFVPDNPEKFPRGIDGIVISHVNNNLNPTEQYKIKVTFNGENGESFSTEKDILPVILTPASETIKPVDVVHVYGFNYKTRQWVPMPVDPKLIVLD